MRILGELVHNHPMFTSIILKKVETTRKLTDFLPLKKFHDTALYSEFYKHIGGDSQMMTAFTVSPKLYVTCTLHRVQKDFSERDLSVLKILAPHLIAAFRNAQFINNLAVEHEPFVNILDNIGYGIITLNAEMNILDRNFKAVKFLHEYFPPSDALPVELENYIRCCDFFSASEVYVPPAPLTLKKPDAVLKIRVSFQTETKSVAIFMEEKTEANPANLLKLGLTRREAEILYCMTEGKTDAEIAESCGISIRTVHKHRENMFIKLGVETRTAAAMLAMEVMSPY